MSSYSVCGNESHRDFSLLHMQGPVSWNTWEKGGWKFSWAHLSNVLHVAHGFWQDCGRVSKEGAGGRGGMRNLGLWNGIEPRSGVAKCRSEAYA